MLNTLRTRLLLSFAAVLFITLCLIGLTLLVFLRTQPLPTADITNRLTATLLDVRSLEVIEVSAGADRTSRLILYLTGEAETRETRLMVITQDGTVQFDSEGVFQSNEQLSHLTQHPLRVSQRNRPVTALVSLVQGRFVDPDGTEWIYVGQPLRPRLAQTTGTGSLLVAAEPVPKPTLREVIRIFGDEFLRPLARAGLLGLLIALGLSALIARSVARPLQRISRAARRIANGDYDQRVPVGGPKEVSELAVSFNEMATRVAASQQVQRDFLANVSHDLRTPLTSIQGFSQAILDGVASDPDSAAHAAQIINDEAARMHRMVEGLLDLARIEAGKLDMRRQAVRISDLLQTIGESVSMRARDKGLRLEVTVPSDLPRIAGDGDRLAQVFTNLLDNAIKHTPAGGQVTLQAHGDHQGVTITVGDTGEGIPAEDLPRVFERFYQVDKSRRHDPRSGMGLGLAITYQIVKAHGGTIQVASQVGRGTIFTIWLPIVAQDMSTVTTRRN
jgi:signal transduction histidine kinase